MRSISFLAIGATILAGCGGHASSGPFTDPRVAAIETFLDSKTTKFQVPNGPHSVGCDHPYTSDPSPSRYAKVKGAHVRPSGYSGLGLCYIVTWDKSVPLIEIGASNGDRQYAVDAGHYIVDKVGDEEDGPLGVKETPYKAHFIATPVGKSLIAAGLFNLPSTITDGQAELHKDADGKWVAGL